MRGVIGKICKRPATASSQSSMAMESLIRPRFCRQAASQRVMHERTFPDSRAIASARADNCGSCSMPQINAWVSQRCFRLGFPGLAGRKQKLRSVLRAQGAFGAAEKSSLALNQLKAKDATSVAHAQFGPA